MQVCCRKAIFKQGISNYIGHRDSADFPDESTVIIYPGFGTKGFEIGIKHRLPEPPMHPWGIGAGKHTKASFGQNGI